MKLPKYIEPHHSNIGLIIPNIEAISIALITQNITPAELSRLCKCNNQHIYHILSGRTLKPGIRIMATIAQILNLNLTDIIKTYNP